MSFSNTSEFETSSSIWVWCMSSGGVAPLDGGFGGLWGLGGGGSLGGVDGGGVVGFVLYELSMV
jgi:hypothetical protein